MADQFAQDGSNTGTTSVQVILSGVAAGNTLIAFALDGSTTAPATKTVSDGQGSYTALGTPITDATNNIWAQAFYLTNANAGSHTVTATFDATNSVFLCVVEVQGSGTPTSNAQVQANPGGTTDIITSGSVTIASAATLIGFSADTSTVGSGNIPLAGTGFTSRDSNFNSAIGSWRLETLAASANAAATFTRNAAIADNFATLGVAVVNAAVVTASTTILMAQACL